MRRGSSSVEGGTMYKILVIDVVDVDPNQVCVHERVSLVVCVVLSFEFYEEVPWHVCVNVSGRLGKIFLL